MSAFAQSKNTLTVAVASNFRLPFERLVSAFEQSHPVDVVMVNGSTGILYAQIVRGAPYQLFLAADSKRPALLKEQGLASDLVPYTYGRLVAWAPEHNSLGAEQIQRWGKPLALAQADIAPYGLATEQVLERINWQFNRPQQLIRGKSVAQVAAMVGAGAIELGFISDFQAKVLAGARWLVPTSFHQPIEQSMVLLKQQGRISQSAKALYDFILSKQGQQLIASARYLADA